MLFLTRFQSSVLGRLRLFEMLNQKAFPAKHYTVHYLELVPGDVETPKHVLMDTYSKQRWTYHEGSPCTFMHKLLAHKLWMIMKSFQVQPWNQGASGFVNMNCPVGTPCRIKRWPGIPLCFASQSLLCQPHLFSNFSGMVKSMLPRWLCEASSSGWTGSLGCRRCVWEGRANIEERDKQVWAVLFFDVF